MGWLTVLWILEVIGIETLPMSQLIFICFSKNGHKTTQTRCKVCSNLPNVLQELSFVWLLSFLLTLDTFHTLPQRYYSNFEKKNVGWKCVINFCQNGIVMLTYTHNHAAVWLIRRSYCHIGAYRSSYLRSEKQNSNSFSFS